MGEDLRSSPSAGKGGCGCWSDLCGDLDFGVGREDSRGSMGVTPYASLFGDCLASQKTVAGFVPETYRGVCRRDGETVSPFLLGVGGGPGRQISVREKAASYNQAGPRFRAPKTNVQGGELGISIPPSHKPSSSAGPRSSTPGGPSVSPTGAISRTLGSSLDLRGVDVASMKSLVPGAEDRWDTALGAVDESDRNSNHLSTIPTKSSILNTLWESLHVCDSDGAFLLGCDVALMVHGDSIDVEDGGPEQGSMMCKQSGCVNVPDGCVDSMDEDDIRRGNTALIMMLTPPLRRRLLPGVMPCHGLEGVSWSLAWIVPHAPHLFDLMPSQFPFSSHFLEPCC